jgi:hypothetical protein
MMRAKEFARRVWPIILGFAILAGPMLWSLAGQGPAAQAEGCWQAEITAQWPNLDLEGSVLRVSVLGKVGLPVTIRSLGGYEAVGFTGTKPEYGPFVAEFAAMSRGTYFIEPQGLGIVFEVWLDGKNYTRVDFTPLPCEPTPSPLPTTAPSAPRPQVTATHRPVVTPTPFPPPARPSQPAAQWRGRIVQHLKDLEGRYYATIAVRVIGRPAGQEVEIRSDPWSEVCKTGTKPEHGPDACEFGALRAGTYRITPKGLDTYLDVKVDLQDFVLVEFYFTGGSQVQTRWVGSVVENTSGDQPTEHHNSAIAVVVAGKPWYQVEIRANSWSSTCTTGTKPEYGPDACEFGGLQAATYTITPKDLGVSAQVTMDGWGWAKVRFEQVTVNIPRPTSPPPQPTSPPGAQPTAIPPAPSPTAAGPLWQGQVVSNTSGEQEGAGVWSVIVVRVLHWPGVPVDITGGGGWSATCVTGTKPEYGPDACEFGGLWPGIYYLQPQGADIQVEVEMDGLGIAFVEFSAP